MLEKYLGHRRLDGSLHGFYFRRSHRIHFRQLFVEEEQVSLTTSPQIQTFFFIRLSKNDRFGHAYDYVNGLGFYLGGGGGDGENEGRERMEMRQVIRFPKKLCHIFFCSCCLYIFSRRDTFCRQYFLPEALFPRSGNFSP